MLRVLQVVTKMDRCGLETLLMNYYRNIDRSKVQFDFLTHREERGQYDDEIEQLGGNIYHVPHLNPLYPEYYKALDDFFEIAIGKPLKLSPIFPPLHTGQATFTASGVPSIKQFS